jgi:FkbM family methyltransferase
MKAMTFSKIVFWLVTFYAIPLEFVGLAVYVNRIFRIHVEAYMAFQLVVVGDKSHFAGSALNRMASLANWEVYFWSEGEVIPEGQKVFIRWDPHGRNKVTKSEINAISEKIINDTHFNSNKSNVQDVFAKVFNYPLKIDPLNYPSPFVMKSDGDNGIHDGTILNQNVEPQPGKVYQRLVNNNIYPGFVQDLRVCIINGVVPLVYRKIRSTEIRFTNTQQFAEVLTDISECLSDSEIKQILAFSREIGLEYGELDVLRDSESNLIYIVDANNTPYAPVSSLTADELAGAMSKLAGSFLELWFRTSKKPESITGTPILKSQPKKLIDKGADLLAGKNHKEAATIYKFGAYKWPNEKDIFGHKVFVKELIRNYLALDDFVAAVEAVQEFGADLCEVDTLFARAAEKVKDLKGARNWWLQVFERDPFNPELIAFNLRNPDYSLQKKDVGSIINPQLKEVVKLFPEVSFNVVFDIGANTGMSTESFLEVWPWACVHAFEPSVESFRKMKENFRYVKGQVEINNLAVSQTLGELHFKSEKDSPMNRVVPDDSLDNTIVIESTTLDDYCSSHNIKSIDYLKIDTEGHEFSVLIGGKNTLKDVKFIELEASMNIYNKYHESFVELFNYLSNSGFYLFKIYEQTFEWTGGGHRILRRSNPVFVNSLLIGDVSSTISS